MVKNINSSFTLANGFALIQQHQKAREELEELNLPVAPDVVDVALPKARQISGSSNVMSQNFFNSNYEQSKYIQGTITKTQQEQTDSQKMTAIVGSLVTQAVIWDMERKFGDGSHPIENTYLIGARLGLAASKATQKVQEEKTAKESQRNLDEIKEELERKAQEATASTDENGNPIEGQIESENAEEAAMMPEIADTSQNSAPDSMTEPSQNGQVLAPPADAHVSNDINTSPEPPVVAAAPSVNLIV